jgi:uncharacterized phage protein (TIGR02220 family)
MRALSKHSGIAYRGSEAHVALILGRLRAGASELELRKVAWYCAAKLGWKDKPEMRSYLRPETLFGPKSIERYLDAAVSAYRAEFKTDADVRKTPEPVPFLEVGLAEDLS